MASLPDGEKRQNKNRTEQSRFTKLFGSVLSGDPWGNRTPVFAVRGRRLNRLTNRPCRTRYHRDTRFSPHGISACLLYHILSDFARGFFNFFDFFCYAANPFPENAPSCGKNVRGKFTAYHDEQGGNGQKPSPQCSPLPPRSDGYTCFFDFPPDRPV